MSNYQNKITPKFLYRVEKINPEIVFKNGLKPYGTNTEYFNYILGHSLNRNNKNENSSFFISTSDSKAAAMRFFGSMDLNENNLEDYYLYKIKADQNFYSSTKTAMYYLANIKKKQLSFKFGNYVLANDAIDFILKNFSHERLWFHVGPISGNKIECAWKIDFQKLDKSYLLQSENEISNLAFINCKKIKNMGYKTNDLQANFLPYEYRKENDNEDILISVPETSLYIDSSGGVATSIGFSLCLDKNTNVVQKYRNFLDVQKSGFGNCFIDKVLLNKPLRYKKQIGIYNFSKPIYSLISLCNKNEDKNYWVGWKEIENKFVASLLDRKKYIEASQFIYDTYQRISLMESDSKIAYCLSICKTNKEEIFEIRMRIATINDNNQKFYFEHCNDIGKPNLFKIKSIAYKNYTFFRKKDDLLGKIYLMDEATLNPDYEILYININKDKTLSNMLLQQQGLTQLLDLQLSWYSTKQFFTPIPESGFSKAVLPKEKSFFYDLNTNKIIYINKDNEIFCLYNKRHKHSSKWDWIRWKRADLEETNDQRYRWFIEPSKSSNYLKSVDIVKIRSFENNDYLNVFVKGTNWGSLFTSNSPNDSTSFSDFFISTNSFI